MTDELLPRVIGALEQVGIPYMLTGSWASSFHGTPRATQDIDIVIAPTSEQLRSLVALFPPSDYYFDEKAAQEARREEGQFNVIDFATGWKVDLIIRKSRPFSQEEFDRRSMVEMGGMRLTMASAEDVVLAKLEWAKMGESHRQIEDAANILRLRWGTMDRAYLEKWIRQLDLQRQWAAACRAGGITP